MHLNYDTFLRDNICVVNCKRGIPWMGLLQHVMEKKKSYFYEICGNYCH